MLLNFGVGMEKKLKLEKRKESLNCTPSSIMKTDVKTGETYLNVKF